MSPKGASMPIEGLVLDVDGTLVRGRRALVGAPEALAALRQMKYQLVLCTQENQLSDYDVAQRLGAVGLSVGQEEIVSAGTVAIDFLTSTHRGSQIYVMGSDKLRNRIEQSGMKVLSDQEGNNAEVVLIGTDPDVNLTRLSTAAEAVRRGANFYVTNLDRGYPLEDRIIPSAGSLALAVAFTAGRRPLVLGKPSQIMATAIRNRLLLPTDSIAVIGDQPSQDIRLGKVLGATTVLVLSGITTLDIYRKNKSMSQPDIVLPSIREVPRWLDQFQQTQ